MKIPLEKIINAGVIHFEGETQRQVQERVDQTSQNLLTFNQAPTIAEQGRVLKKILGYPLP
ncbi:hypothetical protein HU830_02935 [Lactobacillus sp. DCY120]|uniref:Uncharacterized protein n=1 Tax=Bombilactobacillus apium TaxID=2675299 RepID=A0A850R5L7_9LACO|nr:hypothetical protein [Bombilactobacillus apium]NVY96137.1 hypothetical protein [Bombilactobacillus apium]